MHNTGKAGSDNKGGIIICGRACLSQVRGLCFPEQLFFMGLGAWQAFIIIKKYARVFFFLEK